MKSYMAKPHLVNRKCWVVDATGIPIGRLTTRVATILQGKHKPTYTPHIDTGDMVIVINAAKIAATGKKETDKIYYRHTGYPGGIKMTTLKQMRAKHPIRIVEHAVRGMLPKGPLGRDMYRKLRVYAGAVHEHAAQQPEILIIQG